MYVYVSVCRTWGNFGGGGSFGELMALKSLARENLANLLAVYQKPQHLYILVGKILANCQPFTKFAGISPLQGFPVCGIYCVLLVITYVYCRGILYVYVHKNIGYPQWASSLLIMIVIDSPTGSIGSRNVHTPGYLLGPLVP